MTTGSSRSLKFYCPTHRIRFQALGQAVIPCEQGGHTAGSGFPTTSWWEFCCDCDTFWPTDPPNGSLQRAECLVCERPIARRYLCSTCQVVSLESSTLVRRKTYSINNESGIAPDCPGCSTVANGQLQQHDCAEVNVRLLTSRSACPFCANIFAGPPATKAEEPEIPAMSACPFCGTEQKSSNRFCKRCGKPQPDLAEAAKAREAAERRKAAEILEQQKAERRRATAEALRISEEKRRHEESVKRKAEEERLRVEEERRRKQEQQRIARELQRRLEEEAALRAEEARLRQEEEARQQAEQTAEAERRLEEEARQQAEREHQRRQQAQQEENDRLAAEQRRAEQEEAQRASEQQSQSSDELEVESTDEPPDESLIEVAAIEEAAASDELESPSEDDEVGVTPLQFLPQPSDRAAESTSNAHAIETAATSSALDSTISETQADETGKTSGYAPSWHTPAPFTAESPRRLPRFLIPVVIGVVAVGILLAMFVFKSGTNTDQPPGGAASPAPTKPNIPTGMVLVNGGEFLMGNDAGDEYERPAHKVTVQPFYIDVHEVTCEDYLKFVAATSYKSQANAANRTCANGPTQTPVTGVDWYDASAYALYAKKRLPTEAEWEFAARGTEGRKYPWGNEWKTKAANIGAVTKGVVEVGSYPAGGTSGGVMDLIGNAWEWTSSDLKPYPGGHLPTKPRENDKVIRGGSWKEDNTQATSTYRGFLLASGEKDYSATGIRCVQDIAPQP